MSQIADHEFFGIHVLGEMYGIESKHLDDVEYLSSSLEKGISLSGATLCSMQHKKFDPHGVTLLALLSESHASIHTYPESGCLFFDAFTCGVECCTEAIANTLVEILQPKRTNLQTIKRGTDPRDMLSNIPRQEKEIINQVQKVASN